MKRYISFFMIIALLLFGAMQPVRADVTYDVTKSINRNIYDALATIANANNAFLSDVLFVDSDRTDDYVANGTLAAPYKTIQAADTASVSGDVIIVAPGAYAETVTLNAGVHLFGWNVTGATLTGEYVIFNGSTIDFSGNLVFENGETIANSTNGIFDIGGQVNIVPGTTGGLLLKVQEVEASITADASITVDLTIPTGSMIVGVQYQVETALADTETWDASFHDGAELWEFADDIAVAQNTEGSAFWPVNTATNITDADTNIVIDGNGATGAFTAQGVIRFIIYYYDFSAMTNAS